MLNFHDMRRRASAAWFQLRSQMPVQAEADGAIRGAESSWNVLWGAAMPTDGAAPVRSVVVTKPLDILQCMLGPLAPGPSGVADVDMCLIRSTAPGGHAWVYDVYGHKDDGSVRPDSMRFYVKRPSERNHNQRWVRRHPPCAEGAVYHHFNGRLSPPGVDPGVRLKAAELSAMAAAPEALLVVRFIEANAAAAAMQRRFGVALRPVHRGNSESRTEESAFMHENFPAFAKLARPGLTPRPLFVVSAAEFKRMRLAAHPGAFGEDWVEFSLDTGGTQAEWAAFWKFPAGVFADHSEVGASAFKAMPYIWMPVGSYAARCDDKKFDALLPPDSAHFKSSEHGPTFTKWRMALEDGEPVHVLRNDDGELPVVTSKYWVGSGDVEDWHSKPTKGVLGILLALKRNFGVVAFPCHKQHHAIVFVRDTAGRMTMQKLAALAEKATFLNVLAGKNAQRLEALEGWRRSLRSALDLLGDATAGPEGGPAGSALNYIVLDDGDESDEEDSTAAAAADAPMRIVSWNLEAYETNMLVAGKCATDTFHFQLDDRLMLGAEAALAASDLHPDVTDECWDVLVLVESGKERVRALWAILENEAFGYEWLPRPGEGPLGVLIVWRKGVVVRCDKGVKSIRVHRKWEADDGNCGNFAFLAVPLRRPGWNEGVWVGGVHLKAGVSPDDGAVRRNQCALICKNIKEVTAKQGAPRQAVLAGDFNSGDSEEEPVRQVQGELGLGAAVVPRFEDFTHEHTTHVRTHTERNPYRCPIDFAVLTSGLEFEMRQITVKGGGRHTPHVGVLEGTHVSDHVPLNFSVKLKHEA